VRRPLALALVVLPLVAAACSGADAQKAQDLLAQSQTSELSLRSEAFSMHMNLDEDGQSVVVDADGGMLLKGPRAGDFYATMTTGLTGAVPVNMVMVKRGPAIELRTAGGTRTVPLPAGTKPTSAGFDLNAITPYVKDVSVSTLDIKGRTEDEVTGTIDGDAFLKSLPGVSAGMLSNLGASLGDIKVSLFIPRDSQLIETALLDMTMHVAKHAVHMSLSYAVTSVNRPLVFPR
jgi:hypothetical protein